MSNASENRSEIVARLDGLDKSELVRATAYIRRAIPNVTDKTLARYVAAGFTGEKLDLALELVDHHKSTLPHIVRWNQKLRLSMPRIKLCLAVRDEYGTNSMSVALISRFLTNLGFSENDAHEIEEIPDSVMEVMSTFMEFGPKIGGDYPVHRIWHRIEEEFGSNVQEAYHLALTSEKLFIGLINKKVSREEALRQMYAEDETPLEPDDNVALWGFDYQSRGLTESDYRLVERLVTEAGGLEEY